MDSYNFTYKDVLKRYERIINRPSKFEIRLLATILLIITIVNITSLCFADEVEENINYTLVNGIVAYDDRNYFTSLSTGQVGYVSVEPGYIYTFYNNTNWDDFYLFSSDNQPVVNGTYTIITDIPRHSSYSIRVEDETYLYIGTSSTTQSIDLDSSVPVTRLKLSSMPGSVNDLVENVGPAQFWDIFDTGIGFVGVVVLAAFGIFLVVIAIRKMQKGKSDF